LIRCSRASPLAKRLHSVPPLKRQEDDAETRSIDEEALAGPDGPPPRRLTPEWIAVNLMDITAHLMAAIDKAAGPLDRLADAAEDATAHVAHASRFLRQPLIIGTVLLILAGLIFGGWEFADRGHSYPGPFSAVSSESTELRLGGVPYPLDRKSFEGRLATAQPEEIRKYFVVISGRRFPVKQAVSVGVGAPRASFGTEAAIHSLTKLGYKTEELSH
jgi:hypothetical protein